MLGGLVQLLLAAPLLVAQVLHVLREQGEDGVRVFVLIAALTDEALKPLEVLSHEVGAV